MILVSIVLLNLVIAVISDSYDGLVGYVDAYAVQDKARLITEVDGLVPVWLKNLINKNLFTYRRLLVLEVRCRQHNQSPRMHASDWGL